MAFTRNCSRALREMPGDLATEGRSHKILVVRRDNIGDLVCTTPLLHGRRKKYPEAYIAVLASSYNVEVLDRNPDVDEVFVFLKRHQKSHGYGRLSMLWNRWRLVRTIRRHRFDHIILANGGWRYARTLGGKQMIGFREPGAPDHRQPDVLAPDHGGFDEHEVSKMARLGAMLGVDAKDAMGETKLFPDPAESKNQRARLLSLGWAAERPSVALHISSRKPDQRWQVESFVALAKLLIDSQNVQVLLFWSPGSENDAMHTGDDEKASFILRELHGLPIFPCPTETITQLVAGLSFPDQMICSDGGAMHVAAALRIPIRGFFGTSPPKEWHPWGVPYRHIQKPSKAVADISVAEAFAAYEKLQEDVSVGG